MAVRNIKRISSSPLSSVIAVTALLAEPLPAALDAFMMMVYLLPSSSPVIS